MKKIVLILVAALAVLCAVSCEKEEQGFRIDGTTWYAEDASVSGDDMSAMSVMLAFTESEAVFNILYLRLYPETGTMMINIFYDYDFDAPTGRIAMRGKRGDVWIDDSQMSFEELGYKVEDAYALLDEELMTLSVSMQFGTVTLFPYEEETKSLDGELSGSGSVGQITLDVRELAIRAL